MEYEFTLREKISEGIACFFFAVFMFGMIGLISVSDGFDQHIIESRTTQSK